MILLFQILADVPIHCALFSILSDVILYDLLLMNPFCMVIPFYNHFLFVL